MIQMGARITKSYRQKLVGTLRHEVKHQKKSHQDENFLQRMDEIKLSTRQEVYEREYGYV